MAAKHGNKEYYAVLKGRINEPTIFSSWGDVHPRVTGCEAEYKAFFTIEEAQNYMEKQKILKPKKVIKEGAGGTTPERDSEAFYAVAHGRRPGIYPYWNGEEGSKLNVEYISGGCHKHFRTKAQAQAFIEDWKQSFADVYQAALKEALDQGYRPYNLKLSVAGILQGTEIEAQSTRVVDVLKLEELNLKDK